MGTGSEPKQMPNPGKCSRLGACPLFPRQMTMHRPIKGTGTGRPAVSPGSTQTSPGASPLYWTPLFSGERQLRIYPNTSTKRQRVSPETHLLALRAGMNATAARLESQ